MARVRKQKCPSYTYSATTATASRNFQRNRAMSDEQLCYACNLRFTPLPYRSNTDVAGHWQCPQCRADEMREFEIERREYNKHYELD